MVEVVLALNVCSSRAGDMVGTGVGVSASVGVGACVGWLCCVGAWVACAVGAGLPLLLWLATPMIIATITIMSAEPTMRLRRDFFFGGCGASGIGFICWYGGGGCCGGS